MIAWTLFYNPIELPSSYVLWLALPLVFFLSLTYRAIRTKNIDKIWLESLKTFIFLTLGLAGFAIALYIAQIFATRFL